MTLSRASDSVIASPAPTTRSRLVPRGEWLLFLHFVGPNIILFGIFSYWPLIYSAYLSTVRWLNDQGALIWSIDRDLDGKVVTSRPGPLDVTDVRRLQARGD